MPLRNPFRRNIFPEAQLTEPSLHRSSSNASSTEQPAQPVEYQLSEINDSGVFVPPSDENIKPSFWHTKSTSSFSTNSNHRSLLSDNEAFTISRESFDSYRRSFDISARSPVMEPARRSLDSSVMLFSSLPAPKQKEDWPELEEEELEEVVLDEEVKPVKKRGLFARFTDDGEKDEGERDKDRDKEMSKGIYSFRLFEGRRKSTGLGDELKSISRNGTPTVVVVED